MQFPRWLSEAQSVRAKTGWAGALCKRFAWHIERRHLARDLAIWLPLTVVVTLACWMPLRWAVNAAVEDRNPGPWLRALLITSYWAPQLAILCVYWYAFRSRLYRMLDTFRAAPWCLGCRYPVPPPMNGRLCPNCPECGEPIPPEIAKLAAAPAKQAEG